VIPRATLALSVLIMCCTGLASHDISHPLSDIRSSSPTYQGMSIPNVHPRMFMTPSRVMTARQWYNSGHVFTPGTCIAGGHCWSEYGLHYLITGNNSDITRVYPSVLADARYIANEGTSGNEYRWWGEEIIEFYDWGFNAMNDQQRSILLTEINEFVTNFEEAYTGPQNCSMNNLGAAVARNDFEWGVASYWEQPSLAQGFLDDALNKRWTKCVVAATVLGGGAYGGYIQEGDEYGIYVASYWSRPISTALLYGRNLYNESTWFRDVVYGLIYHTSPSPTDNRASGISGYTKFPDNDDLSWSPSATGDFQSTASYGDAITQVAMEYAGTNVGMYARQWLAKIHPGVSRDFQALDPGGLSLPLSNLPLDYYASGSGNLWAHSSWTQPASEIMLQLIAELHEPDSNLCCVQHSFETEGAFQIWRNGRWLTRSTAGYGGSSTPLAFYGGSATPPSGTYAYCGIAWPHASYACLEDGIGANVLLFNGFGIVHGGYKNGDPVVRQLESQPNYIHVDDDLTARYRTSNNPYAAAYDNAAVGHAEREFVYDRDLETLIILDRLQSLDVSGGPTAANTVKTFLLHSEVKPTLDDATHLTITNGTQVLHETTLLPASGGTRRVLDESSCSAGCSKQGQYRVEIDDSGCAVSYFLTVLQARDANTANIAASVQDSNPGCTSAAIGTLTVTLRNNSGRDRFTVFDKGFNPMHGSISMPGRGSVKFRKDVQQIILSDQGPTWSTNMLDDTSVSRQLY